MDEREVLASTMVDHAMAANLVPWPCPCEFGPDGRYRLEELVAAGPHSLVYRATDQSMSGEGFDAAVAIKVSRLPGSGRSEALTVRRVTHPNVLAVTDRGTTPDGLSYLVAEYVDGGDLSQVPLPMPPREAAALVVRIASAVQAVHSAGIVHCDLKPANILLTRTGEPKLGDFGLSHWSSDSGHGSRGNIAFMSPEQFFGTDDALTPPSDIYALGGLLYYLLVGTLPVGQTREEVEAAHRAKRPAPSPGVDRDLDRICTRAMSRDRASRHHSAGELADDLERWLRHEPIPWMRPSPARRAVLLVRRNPVRAVATAAAMMLVAAAAGTLVYNRAEDRRRRAQAQDLAVKLAQDSVEATRARVRAHIANAIGMVKARAHGDLQDEYLPTLVWLDWLANSPLITATGQVPAVQERLDLLSTLIDSNTKAGRPNHMDTMMAKFALARLALADGQYLRPQAVLDDLNTSLVPLLSQDDPVRLSITAMGACANANRALADGAGLKEAITKLQEQDTILSRCGYAESTRRIVISILDRCALAARQSTLQ